MKFIFAASLLALFSTNAFATCTPAKGNWVNASTQTCPVRDQNNEKRKAKDETPSCAPKEDVE